MTVREAKDRIGDAWALAGKLNWPLTGARLDFAFWRGNRNTPALSFTADGRGWHDFATGDKGDLVDLLAKVENLSLGDACERLIALAQDLPPAPARPAPPPRDVVAEEKRANWPDLTQPFTFEELAAIARQRQFPTTAGLEAAVARGILVRVPWFDDGEPVVAWGVTDLSRRAVQVRRLDGKPWKCGKSKSLPGSVGGWPIGLQSAVHKPRSRLMLFEGEPDLLAGLTAYCLLARDPGTALPRDPGDFGFACITGGAKVIHEEALPLFKGCLVEVVAHADETGKHAADVWAQQLDGIAYVSNHGLERRRRADGAFAKDFNEIVTLDSWPINRASLAIGFSLNVDIALGPPLPLMNIIDCFTPPAHRAAPGAPDSVPPEAAPPAPAAPAAPAGIATTDTLPAGPVPAHADAAHAGAPAPVSPPPPTPPAEPDAAAEPPGRPAVGAASGPAPADRAPHADSAAHDAPASEAEVPPPKAETPPAKPDPYGFPAFTIDQIDALQPAGRVALLSDANFNYWYSGALALALGGGGVGKSRWVKGLAIAAILGREYCGFRTASPGRWLLINAEDDIYRAKEDLARFRAGFALTPAEDELVRQNLIMTASGPTQSMPPTDVADPMVLSSLRGLAKQHQPAVVVVDPWESFVADGDANDAGGTRRSIDRLQGAFPGATILIVHHSREGAEATKGAFGFNASAFSKGSKSAMTRARFVINITARDAQVEPGQDHGLVIACGKSNDSRKFDVRAVRMPESGVYRLDPTFDLDDYLEEVDGRRQKTVKLTDLVDTVRSGTTTGADIVAYYEDRKEVSRATIYRLLTQAVKEKLLTKRRVGNADHYGVVEGAKAEGAGEAGDEEEGEEAA